MTEYVFVGGPVDRSMRYVDPKLEICQIVSSPEFPMPRSYSDQISPEFFAPAEWDDARAIRELSAGYAR